jgi:hypothetical protein
VFHSAMMGFGHGIVLASLGLCMMMGFGPISLMVHLTKLGQPMYGSDLGNKLSLLGACIRSD